MPPAMMPQALAVMQAAAPDCCVTVLLPHPATRTTSNKPSRGMLGLLFCVFGPSLVQRLHDRVDAANRVTHLVFGDVVVGLELEALFVQERSGLVVVDVLRRRLALVRRFAQGLQLAR